MHGFVELARILEQSAAESDKPRTVSALLRARRAWEDDVLFGSSLLTPRHYVMRELLYDLAVSSRTIDAFTRACRYAPDSRVSTALRQRRSTRRSSSARTGLLK